jgi:hypothetical protein
VGASSSSRMIGAVAAGGQCVPDGLNEWLALLPWPVICFSISSITSELSIGGEQ